MSFETTPLFGGQASSTFERLSKVEITPTRSLNINRADKYAISKTEDKNEPIEVESEDAKTTDHSAHSLATSLSESSFTTANSFEFQYPVQEELHSESDNFSSGSIHRQEITVYEPYEDKTPIVTPRGTFDIQTPTESDFAPQQSDLIRQTPFSADGFSFERPDSHDHQNRGQIPLLAKVDNSVAQKAPNDPTNTFENGQNNASAKLGYSSPFKAYRRSIVGSTGSIATEKNPNRNSIIEACRKSPAKLPADDDAFHNNTLQSHHLPTADDTFEDSTVSHDDSILRELDAQQDFNNTIKRKNTLKKSSELDLDEQNLAYLFIIAIHAFNSESLENKEDASICLSFEKNDVAFVHTVDESGWGEVTLIKNQARGWVPFNYFSDTVKPLPTDASDILEREIESRTPLSKLFSASAKFLLHPQNTPLANNSGVSFSLEYINGIRDGVKELLEKTDCVSRSNELVKSKPIVKKTRKRLLADWYNLMIKADSYKHTADLGKIETLQKLVLKVVSRGCVFFDIWSLEKLAFEKEKSLGLIYQSEVPDVLNNSAGATRKITRQKHSVSKDLPLLAHPPFAVGRLNEVHELLFTYIGLILGRLDMIEHNPVGCEILETIIHQMIVLLRELLYISKCSSSIMQAKHKGANEYELDRSLDPLLSLVSELVSCIKVFVTQTVSEDFEKANQSNTELLIKDDLYYYTNEGEHLITIVSKMTLLISTVIAGCNNYLRLIGDFELGADREYPNFEQIKISPDLFIKKCSTALLKRLDKLKANAHPEKQVQLKKPHVYSKRLSRYSTIRSGNKGSSLTTPGSQFLQELLPESKPFLRDSSFDQYRIDGDDDVLEIDKNVINDRKRMEQEIIFEKDEKLVGASFRALVFILTDEMSRPNNFLMSTFLLNLKLFSSAIDLIEELIARFDVTDKSSYYERGSNNGQYSSRSSRIKNRRRLVCKVFQMWMESYWDYVNDSHVLPTLINFFNEGISIHLPIESKGLIEIAARLSASTTRNDGGKRVENVQLVSRNIAPVNTNSMISISSSSSSNRSSILSIDEQFIEKYELAKLPTTNSSSISLPLPLLHVGTSSLLTKRNIHDMERLVQSYRSMVDDSVISSMGNHSDITKSLHDLINQWGSLIKLTKAPSNLIHNDMNFVELNPLEIAKQLTLIESTLFLTVRSSDLLDTIFHSKKAHSRHNRNVELVVNFTNLLSNYVIESIVAPNLSLKKRCSRLKSWLNIALSALYFRNFNSVTSIMTALQSHALSRLTPIWDLTSDKYLDLYQYLSKIVHPNNNYKVYRTKLQQLTAGFPSQEHLKKPVLPMVPFFNLFLQDLTFIKDGNSDFRNPVSFRPNNILNIDKYIKVTKVISLMQFLQISYDTEDKVNISGPKRDSFFNLASTMDIDTTSIKHVSLLQEFILYELWRVNFLYARDSDRSYKLSLEIVPRTGF
ncbi:LAFE_0G03466g1_1 [Lachancea fermentati]|uniref:LAFE_0G03466g1_1 n=1 Tax=Lachancea fermentati TaxID=4955 RepID=A0A1G4MH83_LACFM|nr:LAFE_0G03466g1_1 [Lachancea fermentati]